MTQTITTHFQITIPDFTQSPWHSEIIEAFQRLDAIMYGLAVAADAPAYAVATNYVVGNLVQDILTGTLYTCEVVHTSHAANTFATERAAHPTYWQAVVPV